MDESLMQWLGKAMHRDLNVNRDSHSAQALYSL
jgi:hypothetical protein